MSAELDRAAAPGGYAATLILNGSAGRSLQGC